MQRKSPQVFARKSVVWVVGSSRGIGREIAEQFSFLGLNVCCSGRNRKELAATVKSIWEKGGTAFSFPCDIRHPRTVRAAAVAIVRQVGDIDVLVNNAGITVFKSFTSTTESEFSAILTTNLLGPVSCIKAVLPSMMKRKHGWIINILSNAAVKVFEGSTAYTASKAGMLGLSRVLREELRPHGIKVVNVIPGATATGMWSRSDLRKYNRRMMSAKGVAESVVAAYTMPDDVVVDEIRLRPLQGDID